MASHNLNLFSSRSHCILSVSVESWSKQNPSSIIKSRLELVDLAGSERAAMTGSKG